MKLEGEALQHYFLSKLLSKKRESASGCWEWSGKTHRNGYGVVGANGEQYLTHRVAAWLWLGSELRQERRGLDVCHRCDNRCCFNPQHLFVATHKENMEDAKAKGRLVKRGKQTHCRKGHPLSEAHIYVGKQGQARICRICRRANWLRWYYSSNSLSAIEKRVADGIQQVVN